MTRSKSARFQRRSGMQTEHINSLDGRRSLYVKPSMLCRLHAAWPERHPRNASNKQKRSRQQLPSASLSPFHHDLDPRANPP